MDTSFFLRGLLIGFAIAAPVGPIGVLCIRRSLTEGYWAGFVSGLGAASADAVFGCIAGFGLTFLSDLLMSYEWWLRLVGGLFLCYLGVTTFLAEPAAEAAAVDRRRSLVGFYSSTFVLTLTNPLTILSFTAVFAGLGLSTASGDYLAASALVAGVFSGSALWWLLLSGGAGLLRSKLHAGMLRRVNWLSGAIITIFGLLALISLSGMGGADL